MSSSKLIPFGVHHCNGYAIVKINAKLSRAQSVILGTSFNWISLELLPNGLTRIEAVMAMDVYNEKFYNAFKLALLRSKRDFLHDEINLVLDAQEQINVGNHIPASIGIL